MLTAKTLFQKVTYVSYTILHNVVCNSFNHKQKQQFFYRQVGSILLMRNKFLIEYLIPKKISIFFIFIKEFCMSAIIEFQKNMDFLLNFICITERTQS